MQERCDEPEIGAGTKQQWGKNRRSHNHVGHGKPPSAGLALDAAHVEVKTDGGIDERYRRDQAQYSSRRATAEETRDACNRQQDTHDHRRVHHAPAVAAAIMFVGDFKTTYNAGSGGQERKASLEPSLSDSIRDDLQIVASTTARTAD